MRVVALIGMLFALSGSASAMDVWSHHSPMPGSEGGGGHHGDGARGGGGGSYGAPEPVTTVALAIGAGAAGLAAWRRRKSR